MHLTSALALLSVMASAVQIGNACTELCSDAPDGVKEGSSRSSLNLLGHLNLILKLKTDNVPFCGSKIAECADDFGIMIDPNAIYTFSADGRLQKGETCVAPKKCTDSPTGATCECNPATGPIVNPASEKCLDAHNLAVGEPVVLYTCNQALHPNWMMTGDHQIRNTDTDFCLGKRLLPGQSNTGLVVEKCDSENPGLKWTIENAGGITDKDGLCIDVPHSNYDD
ncbi:hypothetical protein CPB97_005014, partial [Podila verticillata]